MSKKLKENKECVDDIMNMRIDGYSVEEIIVTITDKYKISYSTFHSYYWEMLEQIRKKSVESSKDVIDDHLLKYDDIYQWLKEHGYTRSAVSVLKKREKIMGIHNEVFEFELGMFDKEEEQSEFELYKLSNKDKVRFMELINKTKNNA